MSMVTLLAMTASLLMGLAFAITRELFGMARKEPVAAATGAAGALPTTAAANARTAARSIPSLARQPSAMAGRSRLSYFC
jgi:hypothetical protein